MIVRPRFVVARAHDCINQGARSCHNQDLTEWMVSRDICAGIYDILRSQGHIAYRLNGTLRDRIKTTNELNVTAAVEPHANAWKGPSASGYMTLCWYTSRRAKALAAGVQDELQKLLGSAGNRGVCLVSEDMRWYGPTPTFSEQRLAFLQDVFCPSIIVEVGFLSNPHEAEYLGQQANRFALGRAIGDGMLSWCKATKEDPCS